jgi:hypothetical protein
MELAPEEQILPVYAELMPLRKRPPTEVLEALQAIRAELRKRFLPLLGTPEEIPNPCHH